MKEQGDRKGLVILLEKEEVSLKEVNDKVSRKRIQEIKVK
jgi:hypothetical protein